MTDSDVLLNTGAAVGRNHVRQPSPAPITPREVLAIAAILLVQLGVLVSLAWQTGVTIDEPSHLLSSCLYWHGADRLTPGDVPPLIKITGGWVPALKRLPIPYDHHSWPTRKEWDIAMELMGRMSAEQIHSQFFHARLPLLLFPLLCSVILWYWGRQLFSPQTGILIALLFALSPNVLGHGALFKNDLAATFAYLLFWFRAWAFWRSPTLRNTAWLATALLVAMLAKMSLLVLAPIAPMVVAARFCTIRPFPAKTAAVSTLVLILIPYIGVNAAWQFDSRPLTSADWDPWKANPHIPDGFVFAAQTLGRVPTPPTLWNGVVSLINSNADAQPTYLLGQIRPNGHPFYFLIALALKIPVPLQLLMTAGLVLASWAIVRMRLSPHHLFWLVPPVLYMVMASLSGLQLGVRLVLPSLGLLFLSAGMALEQLRSPRYAMAVPIVLVLWLAGRDVQRYPHYIAYFNLWSGGPENAIHLLSDSNLDWGQDLRRLAAYVKDHRISKIHLSYFGMDNPFAYIPENQLEIVPPPWNAQWAQGAQFVPKPGVYAVSATLLTGQFFAQRYRDYYGRFRKMQPVARAGYSIYIYRVP